MTTKQHFNTSNNNDANNTAPQQRSSRGMAKTASTADQEFLTFLSTMDLPDEGVFANINNFRYNNNNSFVASPMPTKHGNVNQFQQKNHNKKLKSSSLVESSVVSPQTTEPPSSTIIIPPSSSNVISSSLPFPITNQQIQNSNNATLERSVVPNNMKVDGGNMYIQSFLPAGIQNYQQQQTTTTAAPTITTMGVGGVITALPATSNGTIKHVETLRKKKIRNMRDQQRSQSINNQITELRELLQDNGKKFEKTDKFSTLHTVMDFIKDQEDKISALEAEHERYIKKQNNDNNIVHIQNNVKNKNKSNNNHVIFSKPNVNYASIFQKTPIAQATVSLDGKFIDFNESFETLTGFLRDGLLTSTSSNSKKDQTTTSSSSQHDNNADNNNRTSLFHILDSPETVQIVCKAMSHLIECSDNNRTTDDNDNNLGNSGFWQGNVCSKKYPNLNLQMTITLAKSIEMQVPLLFQCTFTKK